MKTSMIAAMVLGSLATSFGQTPQGPVRSVDVYVHDRGQRQAELMRLFSPDTPSYYDKARAEVAAKRAAEDAKIASYAKLHAESWKRAKESYPELADPNSGLRKHFDKILHKARLTGDRPEVMKNYPEVYANIAARDWGYAVVKHPDALP